MKKIIQESVEYDINIMLHMEGPNKSICHLIDDLSQLQMNPGYNEPIDGNLIDLLPYNDKGSDSIFIEIYRKDFGECYLIISRFDRNFINIRFALNFSEEMSNSIIDDITLKIMVEFETLFFPEFIIAGENLVPYIPDKYTKMSGDFIYIKNERDYKIESWENYTKVDFKMGTLFRKK